MSHEDYPGDLSGLFEGRPPTKETPRPRKPAFKSKLNRVGIESPLAVRDKSLPLEQISSWQRVQREALAAYLDALDRVDQLFDLVAKAERQRKKDGTKTNHEHARSAQQIYVRARQELSDLAASVNVSSAVLLDLDVGRKASRARIRAYLRDLSFGSSGSDPVPSEPKFRSRNRPSGVGEPVVKEVGFMDHSEVQSALLRLNQLEARRARAERELESASGQSEARKELFRTQIDEIGRTIARERRTLRFRAPEADASYQSPYDSRREPTPVSMAEQAAIRIKSVLSGLGARLRRLNPFAMPDRTHVPAPPTFEKPSRSVEPEESGEFRDAA